MTAILARPTLIPGIATKGGILLSIYDKIIAKEMVRASVAIFLFLFILNSILSP
jgi:hypothetical protein